MGAAEDLTDIFLQLQIEPYFVPPPYMKTLCECTWPNGFPGRPQLNPKCPIPQHARLAAHPDDHRGSE